MTSSRNSSPDFDILSESEESDCGVIVPQQTGVGESVVSLSSSVIEQPPIRCFELESESDQNSVDALVQEIAVKVDEKLKISENPAGARAQVSNSAQVKHEDAVEQIEQNKSVESLGGNQEGNDEKETNALHNAQDQQDQADVNGTSLELLLLEGVDDNSPVQVTKGQLREILNRIKELENRQKEMEETIKKQIADQQFPLLRAREASMKEALSGTSTDNSFFGRQNSMRNMNDGGGNIQKPLGFSNNFSQSNRNSYGGYFSGQSNGFPNSSNGGQRRSGGSFYMNNQRSSNTREPMHQAPPGENSYSESRQGPSANRSSGRPRFDHRNQYNRGNSPSNSSMRQNNKQFQSAQNMSQQETPRRQGFDGNSNGNGRSGRRYQSPARNWSPPRNRSLPRQRNSSRNSSPPRQRNPPRYWSPSRNRSSPRTQPNFQKPRAYCGFCQEGH